MQSMSDQEYKRRYREKARAQALMRRRLEAIDDQLEGLRLSRDRDGDAFAARMIATLERRRAEIVRLAGGREVSDPDP